MAPLVASAVSSADTGCEPVIGSDARAGGKSEIRDTFTKHRSGSSIFRQFLETLSRLPVYSWAWFLMSMTTFGLATLISAQTKLKSFRGLYEIGLVIYFIGLCQFVFLFVTKAVHFFTVKHSIHKSFSTAEESLFFATFWISCYGMVAGALDYAKPEPGSTLGTTLLSFFWIYLACILPVSMGMYLLIFQTHHLLSKDYTPAWLLPVLPVILVGDLAGALVDRVYPWQLYPALVAGLLCSTLGFLVSLPMAAIYLVRLFKVGFPDPDKRPATMIAVGPPTYVPLAYLRMAKGVPAGYGFFATHPLGVDIVQTLAFVLSIGIFGMGVFFVLMALLPIARRARRMSFHLTWYGFIFPNVGFFSTIGELGLQIPSNGIIWVATAGTILLSVTWLFVTTSHITAIVRKSKALE